MAGYTHAIHDNLWSFNRLIQDHNVSQVREFVTSVLQYISQKSFDLCLRDNSLCKLTEVQQFMYNSQTEYFLPPRSRLIFSVFVRHAQKTSLHRENNQSFETCIIIIMHSILIIFRHENLQMKQAIQAEWQIYSRQSMLICKKTGIETHP